MTYDEAKAEVLALVPGDGEMFVRTTDHQLLRVRFSLAGVVILTYGYEESEPADDNPVPIQRWSVIDWIAAVTEGTLRRATDADVRRSQAAVSDSLARGWGEVYRRSLQTRLHRDQGNIDVGSGFKPDGGGSALRGA